MKTVEVKSFEREVIELLVRERIPETDLLAALDSPAAISCEHTGCGYYLTIRHEQLPSERVVFGSPIVQGKAGDLECGFVVFVEDHELTLECHSWGEDHLPEDLRERSLRIEATA